MNVQNELHWAGDREQILYKHDCSSCRPVKVLLSSLTYLVRYLYQLSCEI